MGRNFAGIMGFAAFLAVVAKGCVHGASIESTIRTALAALFVFAAVGLVIGHLADHTISHCIRREFQKRLTDRKQKITASDTSG